MELFGLICAAGGLGFFAGTLVGVYAVRTGVKIGAEAVAQGLKMRLPEAVAEEEEAAPELKMPEGLDGPEDVFGRSRLKQFDTA